MAEQVAPSSCAIEAVHQEVEDVNPPDELEFTIGLGDSNSPMGKCGLLAPMEMTTLQIQRSMVRGIFRVRVVRSKVYAFLLFYSLGHLLQTLSLSLISSLWRL